MDQNSELGYKVRQILNHGTEELNREITERLYTARRDSLEIQRMPARGLQMAGLGHFLTDAVLGNGRLIAAMIALLIGAAGTYVWHQFDEAATNEEVDSALLADELPPSAYLDNGFRAWLDRSLQASQSSQ